jgi:hypothetical protein
MKILKNILLVSLTLVLSVSLYGLARASENRNSENDSTNVVRSSEVDNGDVQNNDQKDSENQDINNNSTSSNQKDSENQDINNNSTSSNQKDSENEDVNKSDEEDANLSKDHMNRVSEFANKLYEVGKEDRQIKNDADDIAKETLDSGTSTSEAIDKVNERGAFTTFFLGSDYKNLGKLRSELARTDKIVERLDTLASSTADSAVQAQLNDQIKILQDAQAKVKTFVTSHENSFSLFGWFMKFFNN